MSLEDAVADPSPGPCWHHETSPVSEGSDELDGEKAPARAYRTSKKRAGCLALRNQVLILACRLVIQKIWDSIP